MVQLLSIDLILLSQYSIRLFQFLNSFIGSKANPWQQLKLVFPMLKFSLSDSAKKSTTLQFLLESLVEVSGISALQNLSYHSFLKILNPV